MSIQDRYAGFSGPGSFRGIIRGGFREGMGASFRGGFRGGGLRGGFGVRGGGMSEGARGGRDFSTRELYTDYSALNQNAGGRADGGGGYGGGMPEPEPSQQIMVRNVCIFLSGTGSY
jgi:hypothetical protein